MSDPSILSCSSSTHLLLCVRAYTEEVRMRINVASLVEKLAPFSRVGRETQRRSGER